MEPKKTTAPPQQTNTVVTKPEPKTQKEQPKELLKSSSLTNSSNDWNLSQAKQVIDEIKDILKQELEMSDGSGNSKNYLRSLDLLENDSSQGKKLTPARSNSKRNGPKLIKPNHPLQKRTKKGN